MLERGLDEIRYVTEPVMLLVLKCGHSTLFCLDPCEMKVLGRHGI